MPFCVGLSLGYKLSNGDTDPRLLSSTASTAELGGAWIHLAFLEESHNCSGHFLL